MNEVDKKYIMRMFLRVMSNQALILSALGASACNRTVSKALLDRAEELAKELTEAAELVKLEK